MWNTKIIVSMFAVFGLGILFNQNVFAATYYVRTDGGTPTQCTGTTNAAYPGSGTAQACALSHPVWALGATGTTGVLKGGDTLIIDDTDHVTNGQAQYKIGYGMPNTVSANCYLNWTYACMMSPIPSGPDATRPTKIVGSSYNSGCAKKPQLWGTDGVNQIFDLSKASNVDMECLELTDHSNCGFRVGNPVCAENWNAGQLSGSYGRTGIYAQTGSNFLFVNMDVHGFANRGFLMGGINGITFSYVNMDGNYMSNWDGDVGETNNLSYNTGAIVLDHVKNRFAGCSEAYPRSASFNTTDYSNCVDQNDSPPGYWDGLGMYKTGGNWVITNSEFSHNASDGLDLLYHDATGSITVQRSLFEGNNGNQLKVTSPIVNVENSVLIGNCNYLSKTGKVKNTATWSSCRAGADTIAIVPTTGGTYRILNSSFYTDGNSQVALTHPTTGDCNGTETYSFRNNIYVGNGYSSVYINGLSGVCATPSLDTDYSIINNIGNDFCPSGSHNKCATDPKWVGTISQTVDSNLPNVYLQSTSPAIGSGLNITGISSLDYNGIDRGTTWDMAALQNGSVPATTSTTATITPTATTTPTTTTDTSTTSTTTTTTTDASTSTTTTTTAPSTTTTTPSTTTTDTSTTSSTTSPTTTSTTDTTITSSPTTPSPIILRNGKIKYSRRYL